MDQIEPEDSDEPDMDMTDDGTTRRRDLIDASRVALTKSRSSTPDH